MEWITSNWYIIVALVAVLTAVVVYCIKFAKLPTSKQIANVKEWLKYAVTQAEKELGGGTGQLKLSMVYNMAVQAFPWIATVVTFNTFSKWVDEALVWLKLQIESNKAIKEVVDGN